MKKRKFSESLIGILIITYLFYEVISGITGTFIEIIISQLNITNTDILDIIINYLVYTVPTIIIFLLLMLRKNNKYMLSRFSLKNNKILVGIGIGFLMNATCILIAYLNNDLTFKFNYFNIPILLFAFFSIAIQCAAEEIVCRIFLYDKLIKKYKSPLSAIIINSVFFSLIHLGNTGITLLGLISIFGMGIVTSLMVYYYDNIWSAIAIHTSWNFTQNIIFGLPNSGFVSSYSVLKLVDSKNSFAYNTTFGVESTYVALAILFIVSLIIYLLKIKKDKPLKKMIKV